MIVGADPDYWTVYVVDSRPQDYAELAKRFAEHELQLQIFGAGREALRSGAVQPPDLWIINLDLPDMSGPDLLAMLRWRSLGAPMVLVSDVYDLQAEIVARASRPFMVLRKPLESALLMSILLAEVN